MTQLPEPRSLPDTGAEVFAGLVRGFRHGAHVWTINHNLTEARLPEYARQQARAEHFFSPVDEVELQQTLVAQLGRPAQAFAWLYGSDYQTLPSAHPYLAAAGYRYLFSNFKVQRLGRGAGAA